MQVFLNGAFIDRDHARLSVFDAALQHGVGLFETLLVRRGSAVRGRQHMERLARSALELGLAAALDTERLLDAVHRTAAHNGLESARVRLTLTGGDLNLLQAGARATIDPGVVIVAQPPTPYPDEIFEQGALVTIASARATPLDPLAGHKTVSYWSRLRLLREAAARGAGESLWLTVGGHLAGGCVSNAFLVREGRLLTPTARTEGTADQPSCVLPGVTRAALIEAAAELGMECERRQVTLEDLLAADELFLTNASWGVLPVRGIEAHVVGTGRPGPVTRRLREAWLQIV